MTAILTAKWGYAVVVLEPVRNWKAARSQLDWWCVDGAATRCASPTNRSSVTLVRLWLEPGSNELVFHGKASGGSAGFDAQLAVDGGQMRVDGAAADDKPISYLDIGQSLRYQAQYLHLSRSQTCRIGGACFPGHH